MVFLRAIQIHSTSSFKGEVNPSAPCRKILRHVKELYRYERRYFIDKIHHFLHPVAPDLLLDGFTDRFPERALVNKSGAFPCRHGPTMIHAHLSSGGLIIGLLVAAVQRHFLTPSI
jgi:hypothetical protein